jgi:death-on-curing protein
VTDYLSEEEALAVVERLGFQVRDLGLLGSAIARPSASAFGEDAYPDIITKAAALFESLVRNHPLFDGNRRLSVVLTWTFLLNNGVRLEHGEDDAYDFVIDTAAGERSLEQIGSWFAEHARPVKD